MQVLRLRLNLCKFNMQALGFVINYVDADKSDADKMRFELARIYPEASVVMIYDNPRLKTPKTVGHWIARYLTALETNVIIKIDPDAEIIDRPKIRFSGNVFCCKKWRSVSGVRGYIPHAGVIGFSKECAYRVAQEAIKPEYENYPKTRDDYNEEIVLKAIFEKLKINVQDRVDFHCGISRYNGPGHVSFRHI